MTLEERVDAIRDALAEELEACARLAENCFGPVDTACMRIAAAIRAGGGRT
jgi:hypothetical protein